METFSIYSWCQKNSKNSAPCQELLQTEIMLAQAVSRAIMQASTLRIWNSRRERSLLAYLSINESNRRLCKNHPVPSSIIEGLANIGTSASREPNTSENICQWISQLLTIDKNISIGSRVVGDNAMTPEHTTLRMAILIATGDSKLTSVSHKSKRYI